MATVPSVVDAADAAAVRKRRWAFPAVVLFLVAAAAVAFGNGLHGCFVYDSLDAIVNNEHIRRLWPLSEAMSLPLWNSGYTVDGRPILSLSFALNYAAVGLYPPGFRIVNIAIHLAAALLLFGLVRRTLELPRFRARFGGRAAWLALAVALLWMVHPLQTESVTYIVQRAESMAGMFSLATLYGAMRGMTGARAGAWYALSIGCCVLGLGTKETVVTAPAVVFLYDGVFIAGSYREALRRRWRLYAGLLASWALPAWIVFATWGDKAQATQAWSPLAYAATQPGVILHYLRLSFWPDPLVLHYKWPMATTLRSILVPGVPLAAALALTAWGVLRRRWYGFAGAWFFVILAPTSTFFPLLQKIQEHRMYLSLAAVVLVVVLGADRLLQAWGARWGSRVPRWTGVAFCLVAAGALSSVTFARNKDYASELAMWNANVEDRPESVLARVNLAAAMLEKGETAEAVEQLKKAIALNPNHYGAYNNLAYAMNRLGRPQEAIGYVRHALELNPRCVEAYLNLASIQLSQGNAAKAIECYREALKLDPTSEQAVKALGALLLQAGQVAEASEHLAKAVALNPRDKDARNDLAVCFMRTHQFEAAIGQLNAALALDPEFAPARRNLEIGRKLMEQSAPGATSPSR